MMLLSSIFLASTLLGVQAQNPPYGNSSTLPLYGPTLKPEIADIACSVSVDGWFEALMGALLPFKSTKIINALFDPGDGTVSVSLHQRTLSVDKAAWGKCAAGLAWPDALWSGLEEVSAKADAKIETSVLALTGVTAEVTPDCSVPINGTSNPYDQARVRPVLARLRKNTTETTLSNRYLHILPDMPSGNANLVYFGGVSVVNGTGPAVKTMKLDEWMKNCEKLYIV